MQNHLEKDSLKKLTLLLGNLEELGQFISELTIEEVSEIVRKNLLFYKKNKNPNLINNLEDFFYEAIAYDKVNENLILLWLKEYYCEYNKPVRNHRLIKYINKHKFRTVERFLLHKMLVKGVSYKPNFYFQMYAEQLLINKNYINKLLKMNKPKDIRKVLNNLKQLDDQLRPLKQDRIFWQEYCEYLEYEISHQNNDFILKSLKIITPKRPYFYANYLVSKYDDLIMVEAEKRNLLQNNKN